MMDRFRVQVRILAALGLGWIAWTQLRPYFGLFAPRYASVTVSFRKGDAETLSDAKYWEDLAGRINVTAANKQLRAESPEINRIDFVTKTGTKITINR